MLHVLGWLPDVVVHHISILPAAAYSVNVSQARCYMWHAWAVKADISAPSGGQCKKLLQRKVSEEVLDSLPAAMGEPGRQPAYVQIFTVKQSSSHQSAQPQSGSKATRSCTPSPAMYRESARSSSNSASCMPALRQSACWQVTGQRVPVEAAGLARNEGQLVGSQGVLVHLVGGHTAPSQLAQPHLQKPQLLQLRM